MKKINGIIHEGKVYVADTDVSCRRCDLRDFCNKFEDKTFNCLCITFDNHGYDYGYRYSPELTDKLNNI